MMCIVENLKQFFNFTSTSGENTQAYESLLDHLAGYM